MRYITTGTHNRKWVSALEQLMQKILLLLEESAEGLSTKVLIRLTAPTEELPLSNGHRVWAINELIYAGKLSLIETRGANASSQMEEMGKVDLQGGQQNNRGLDGPVECHDRCKGKAV